MNEAALAFTPDRIWIGVVQWLILLFALTLHEAAHAWVAERRGDSTGRALGRVTLNPLPHLDLFGTLILPLMLFLMGGPMFGWARPVPLVARNLKKPSDQLWVAAAGPLANLILSAVATILSAVLVHSLGQEARQSANVALQAGFLSSVPVAGLPHFPLIFTLVQVACLSATLAVFHLLPLLPLDGGRILYAVMPADWAARFAGTQRIGLLIAMALGVFRIVNVLALPFYIVIAVVLQS
jgi:Zn-dependent protease